MNSNNYEIKKKIVLAGNSEIFKNWCSVARITVEDFLDALEWVCGDPCPDGKLSREIGLEQDRIVKLCRFYNRDGSFGGFASKTDEENGRMPSWEGFTFMLPPENEKEAIWADGDGLVAFQRKISLSCRDRV